MSTSARSQEDLRPRESTAAPSATKRPFFRRARGISFAAILSGAALMGLSQRTKPAAVATPTTSLPAPVSMSLVSANVAPTVVASHPFVDIASTSNGGGYDLEGSDGGIFTFGNAPFAGSAASDHLTHPAVGMALTPDNNGYWLVASDGGVFAFGDAPFHGSMGGAKLNAPVVAMARTPDGNGYWLVGSDGGIFSFGDAGFYGSLGGIHLNKPIVGMAATPDGKGYWLVAADGGVFAFGDAQFYGSLGGVHLNKPIVGMVSTPDGNGYRLVAADGGVFDFGNAAFKGSAATLALPAPVVAIAPTPDGNGYWLATSDGGVYSYGDANFYGAGDTISAPPPAASGAAPTGTGVYGFFTSVGLATTAIRDGWPVVADAGALGTPGAPYTAEVSSHPDLNVASAILGTGQLVNWMSFWTVSWPTPGVSYYTAGSEAGQTAASTLDSYSSSVHPDMVVLDPEGYNQDNAATTNATWRQFLQGWSDGLTSVNPSLTAAFYANQSQFSAYGLSSMPIPGYVAVTPILGNRPNTPVAGSVNGYSTYLATCPAGADVATVNSWGGRVNTIQFNDNGVDCGP